MGCFQVWIDACWFDLPGKMTLAKYLEQQATDGAWGDVTSIKIAAECLQVVLKVANVQENERVFHPSNFNRRSKFPTIHFLLVHLQHYVFVCPLEVIHKLPINDIIA